MTDTADTLALAYVSERDIDLLLVEELRCSGVFREWFLAELAGVLGRKQWASPGEFAVRHSVTGSGKGAGESDLECRFISGGQEILVLIENKIDAQFQPRQAERYRERGGAAVDKGDCAQFLTVLMAPQEYFDSVPGCSEFDATIAYERILAHLQNRTKVGPELSLCLRHKAGMIEQAINRYRRGYAAVPDEAVTSFWAAYYQHVRTVAPGLEMAKPNQKPAGSSFIYFGGIERSAGLPECKLVHKFEHGHVDLQFSGMAGSLDRLTPVFEPLLEPGMRLRAAARSLAITIDVPVLNAREPFEKQADAAMEGISAVQRLLDWFRRNTAALRKQLASLGG